MYKRQAEIMEKAPTDAICMGNVDPAGEFRNGTPASIREATRSVMEKCCRYPNFVISSGCDIPPPVSYTHLDVYKRQTDIYANAGDHIESSGSGPLKKCRAGEVAVGFGLRQQAVADKADGLPIDYVDPTEGNFSLTESVSVLDKGENTNPKAMEMAKCIIENSREELQTYYPNALYEGEETNAANKSAYPKTFPEKLTVDLLQQHQALSEACK